MIEAQLLKYQNRVLIVLILGSLMSCDSKTSMNSCIQDVSIKVEKHNNSDLLTFITKDDTLVSNLIPGSYMINYNQDTISILLSGKNVYWDSELEIWNSVMEYMYVYKVSGFKNKINSSFEIDCQTQEVPQKEIDLILKESEFFFIDSNYYTIEEKKLLLEKLISLGISGNKIATRRIDSIRLIANTREFNHLFKKYDFRTKTY